MVFRQISVPGASVAKTTQVRPVTDDDTGLKVLCEPSPGQGGQDGDKIIESELPPPPSRQSFSQADILQYRRCSRPRSPPGRYMDQEPRNQ